jgi:hypothetical protein
MSISLNNTVFVNGNVEILILLRTVTDFILTCFHGCFFLPSLHFGMNGVLVVRNRNFSKNSFAHQDHGLFWT